MFHPAIPEIAAALVVVVAILWVVAAVLEVIAASEAVAELLQDGAVQYLYGRFS